MDWSWVAYGLAAMDLWDDGAWLELASGQAELARATGALILLPVRLDYLAEFHIQAGNLSLASGLLRRPRVSTREASRDAALRSAAAGGVAGRSLHGLEPGRVMMPAPAPGRGVRGHGRRIRHGDPLQRAR